MQQLTGHIRITYGQISMSKTAVAQETRGQSNLTKSASRGPIPRLGVTPEGRKLHVICHC